ncbi:hypothetical protein [uncultured Methylobacterium sp.]|uniref:hypothetical protein n=1 Tax=uncultured Methylobacterium sp. TaxID=157278 RepID=UPI0035CB819B
MRAASSVPRLAPVTAFASPFDNPVVLWLLVAVGLFVLYPLGELQAVVALRSLPDTDDAMRLVEVRDLMAGQPWFDMNQHRLMPPAGIGMHWSRYVDAPIAALIALATPVFGRALAEGLVAALWPPALFAIYLLLLYRAVSARFGPRAAILSLFMATQAAVLGPLFSFGRIDHHNVQILAVVGLGLCLAQAEGSWRRAALAGGLAAFSLAVGLEALPFLAIAGLVLLVDWIRSGPPALPALCGFSLALALAALLLFLGQTSPRLWLVTACDALSPPWLWISCCAAATGGGAALLSSRLPHGLHRAGFAGLLGIVMVAGFAVLFPECLRGPYTDLPPIVRRDWLEQVSEMLPVWTHVGRNPGSALAALAPLLIAGVVASVAVLRAPVEIRRSALFATLFLLAGFAIGLVQFRGTYMASAVIPFVAGPLLGRAVTLLRREDAGWMRPATLVVALLMVARIWAVPFAVATRLTASQDLQASGVTLQDCKTKSALAPLAGLEPGVILAHIDLGPSILAQTRHAVVAAPYHRAIPGLAASLIGLGGSEADLRRSVASSGATHVVLCRDILEGASGEPRPFATRLAQGEASAPWLDGVPMAGSPLMVWRVRPDSAP